MKSELNVCCDDRKIRRYPYLVESKHGTVFLKLGNMEYRMVKPGAHWGSSPIGSKMEEIEEEEVFKGTITLSND